MINKDMTDKQHTKKTEPSTKPNEVGGIYFSSSIKIFDPETKEVLVQQRGDN
jgi:hypothetical protein